MEKQLESKVKITLEQYLQQGGKLENLDPVKNKLTYTYGYGPRPIYSIRQSGHLFDIGIHKPISAMWLDVTVEYQLLNKYLK